MQLDDEGLAEDTWLLHWVGMAHRAHSLRSSDKPLKIGLAVSGGSDSMAMLHLYARVADEQNYRLHVATVDHGLRPEAADEALFVADTCAIYKIPHMTLKWTDWDGKGNLQAKARDARYQLLANWSKANQLHQVLIGHTTDDQAETFLARLARGSGLDGLAGMDDRFIRDDVEFVRPCLMLEREMLRRYLRRHGHSWRDDPSNEDDKYQRVKARKVLKALEPLGIDADKITSAMSQLSFAKRSLKTVAANIASDIITFEGGDIVMSWDGYRKSGTEIGRRLLGASLAWVGGTAYPPRANAIHGLQHQIYRRKTGTLNGCQMRADRQTVRLSREFQAVKNTICDTGQIWDNRWQLSGPHAPDLEIRALGPDGLPQCPDWRSVGLPRTSLLSSPSIWRGDELIAAPLSNLNPEWTATLVRGEKQFFSSIVPH